MRITNLRKDETPGGARVSATVTWEESERPSQQVWFECRGAPAAEIAPNPDAFLLACAMPAMDFGERRVHLDGTLCPALRNGLQTAFAVMEKWFPELRGPVLEASEGFRPALPRTPPRVASFLSGGIDALATLRSNRLDYPLDHPSSIRDGVYIFGLNTYDFVAGEPVPSRLADFERREARLKGFASAVGVDLITVHTNVRHFAKDFQSWRGRGMGAGLASVAHAFSTRISRALIGSGGRKGNWPPMGSHPLLDPNYSSAALRIEHDGLWLSRLEKTALLAEWDQALSVLQCCQRHQIPEALNCGRCNKCMRTLVHLAALGKLEAIEHTDTFPSAELTPEMIHDADLSYDLDAELMAESAELLAARGRPDLAAAARERVGRFREQDRKRRRRDALAQWDRRWLGGLMARLVKPS